MVLISALMIAIVVPAVADWKPGDGHKMHFPQLPDAQGWDVNATQPMILADDWRCSETGLITDIHFWGSWRDMDGDQIGDVGQIVSFVISIHEDIPANPPTIPFSRPGNTLREWEITTFTAVPIDPPTLEAWYDPANGDVIPNDHQAFFQYNIIDIPSLVTDPFEQQEGTIYWLNISAILQDPASTQWGWKSSRDHWNDDAVWALWGNLTWTDIYEPPRYNEFDVSVDDQGVISGGGTNFFGDGWYQYDSGWINIWFYDNPFTYDHFKDMAFTFEADKLDPTLPASLEFAVNWSTDIWSLEGNPPTDPRRPPLPTDLPESLYIGRQTFLTTDLTSPESHSFGHVIFDYNPEWVSIDVMGDNFAVTNGRISHECVSTSLDLAFVITGPHKKWDQPPTINPNQHPTSFYGWDEYSVYGGSQIAVDDWGCYDNRPVTDIHWWGSYIGWNGTTPPTAPSLVPASFHIAIWDDVPAADPPGYSHPLSVLHEWIVPVSDLNERWVNDDYHPDHAPESCFQYDFYIPDSAEWFIQDPDTDNVYWLSIAAMYNTCLCNGDVNADGTVDPADVTVVSDCIFNADCSGCANSCDVNCDGTIDIADMQAILLLVDGNPPSVACPLTSEDIEYPWGWKTRQPDWNDAAVSTPASSPAIGTQFTLGGPFSDAADPWDLAFRITTNRPSEPEACCLPDGTCSDLDPVQCGRQGGSPQGAGTACTAPLACCLPDGTCVMLDPLCCTDQGGTPDPAGGQCTALEACCMPDDSCQMLDPLCCVDQGGTPQGSSTSCSAALQACCLTDGTCQMLDPLCCANLGGTAQGPASQCTAREACCMPDDSCQMLDPLCCRDQGGDPQGPTTQCSAAPQACCLTDGTCEMLDPLCCINKGGTPDPAGGQCTAREACCMPDDSCRMLDPICCRDQGGDPQGTGSQCSAAPVACCLADGTCVMLDPLCCTNLGGTPDPAGGQCTVREACCMPDDTCQMLDPICCVQEGGSPQGSTSTCTGLQGCCLPDGTCRDLDPLCCADLGGNPQGTGSGCSVTSNACCFSDGTCRDLDPLCCDDLQGTTAPNSNVCLGDGNGNGSDDACDALDLVVCEPQAGSMVHPPTYWYDVTPDPAHLGMFCDFHVRVFDPTAANYTNIVSPAGWSFAVHQPSGSTEWWASWWTPGCASPLSAGFTFQFDNANPSTWSHWRTTYAGTNDPNTPWVLDRSEYHAADTDGYGYRVHVPGEAVDEYAKWKQEPTTNPNFDPDHFYGWNEVSVYGGPQIVTDDWSCYDERPITDIHWWGSYLGWIDDFAPPNAPNMFHIGVWTDVPAGEPPQDWSHPRELIREWYVPRDQLDEHWVNYDVYPGRPMDSCFRYDFYIPQAEWFHQDQGTSAVFWLSIAAMYPAPVCTCNGDVDADGIVTQNDVDIVTLCFAGDCTLCVNSCDVDCDGSIGFGDISSTTCLMQGNPPETCCQNYTEWLWGWKTRKPKWNDDAVRIYRPVAPLLASQFEEGTPIENEEGSWDTAFVLTTNTPPPPFNPPIPPSPPHTMRKNRYISFDPNNTNAVAFQVELTTSTYFPGDVGLLGWVGEPDGNGVSHVVPDPVMRVWAEPVVHVGDCEIHTAAQYALRATPDYGASLSAPLLLDSAPQPGGNLYWADCVGPFGSYCDTSYACCDPNPDCPGATCPGSESCILMWSPPEGTTNFNDVSAAIRQFQVIGILPDMTCTDVHGAEGSTGDARFDPPNYIPNFADVQAIIQAFQGAVYPYAGPSSCPAEW